MKLEKDLMTQVSNRLWAYQGTGQILWYSRLQCGKVRVGLHWIKLCEKGTPDWLALVKGNYGLIAFFIECKSATGNLRQEQKDFFDKYTKIEGIHMLVMDEIEELDRWIDQHTIDPIKEITL